MTIFGDREGWVVLNVNWTYWEGSLNEKPFRSCWPVRNFHNWIEVGRSTLDPGGTVTWAKLQTEGKESRGQALH